MVTIRPLGGLGNQLFVYGLGLAVVRKMGGSLKCDLRNFANYEWHDFELMSFSNSIDDLVRPSLIEQIGSRVELIRRARNRFRKIATARRYSNEFSDDSGWQSSLEQIVSATNRQAADQELVLTGYFQDFSPLRDVRDELREQISNLASPSRWFLEKREEFRREPFTSLHIRLGNFTWVKDQTVVQDGYYRRAIDISKHLYGNLPIRVFSDDPEMARREYPSIADIPAENFVATPPKNPKLPLQSPSVETLLLMSEASSAIIGNSTFSLWSAWLSKKNLDRVIAPRPFSKAVARDERFLVPNGWLSVGY